MKKTRLITVYKKPGEPNLEGTRGKSGVYLIYRDGQLRYIGYSSYSLYKTITRHFQGWTAKYNNPVTYVDQVKRYEFKVRIVFCTATRAERLEKALIKRHQPPDNMEKYKSMELTPVHERDMQAYNNAAALPEDFWND